MAKEQVALGIDIGGTNTAFGVVDRNGIILAQNWIPTSGNSVQEYIDTLCRSLQPLIETTGKDKFAGVGIGAPNANFYTGEIAFAPNLPWHNIIPLASLVSDGLHLPVTITNDANAAAIGEMKYGAAKGMKDFILMTLGTGVGSGFVANGQLIYGHDGFAGELGHVIAVREGRLCGCGRKGCLETYASATGIVRSAELVLAGSSEETSLRGIPVLSAQLIYDAALKGDKMANGLFEYTGKILGQVLADAVAITSPEAIIFFGGLANAGELLLAPVRTHMEANLLRIFQNKVKLQCSALPDADAAILGASALVWH